MPKQNHSADEDTVTADQIAYYRAQAPEYDKWWNREGAWDLGPEFNAAWAAEIEAVRTVLDDFNPAGDVLELAAGTGGLTLELARHARYITAVDASPEALDINRAKLAKVRVPVEYVVADLFEWEPPRLYDVAFFSFWLSHVPRGRFENFWSLVDRSLRPSGRFFFLDNAGPERDRFSGLDTPHSTGIVRGPRSLTDLGAGTSIREVADGRKFQVVKRYWAPDDLRAELEAQGWEVTVAETAWAFIYGYDWRT